MVDPRDAQKEILAEVQKPHELKHTTTVVHDQGLLTVLCARVASVRFLSHFVIRLVVSFALSRVLLYLVVLVCVCLCLMNLCAQASHRRSSSVKSKAVADHRSNTLHRPKYVCVSPV